MPCESQQLRHILGCAGNSVEELQNSVFVEKLIQKGYEVIYFTEAIDEYVMTHLTEFDDKKFQDASKDDLKLGKDDKKGMKKLKVSPACSAPLDLPH